MRACLAVVFAAVAGVAAGGCDARGQPSAKNDGVTLVEGRYADFDKAVKEAKGAVVAVDVWATWCGPCRQRFPHLVNLHSKYADFGLVCISVSIDDPEDKETALKFLKKQRATFTNFFWANRDREDVELFTKRYRYGGGIPHMVVFGRNGDRVWNSRDEPLLPEAVERLIKEELDK